MMTEKELARKFIDYLSGDYELFYEVCGIDILGRQGNIITAIEVKLSLNFKVIEQAYRNRKYAHYSYIAIPDCKRTFAEKICEDYGIGVLAYKEECEKNGFTYIVERVHPKLNRRAIVKYKLDKEIYKIATPGAKSGETKTAFSVTVDNLKVFVKRHSGCTIKEALHNIKYHYGSITSAKSCLLGYIDSGVIKNIRRDGNKLFYVDNKK